MYTHMKSLGTSISRDLFRPQLGPQVPLQALKPAPATPGPPGIPGPATNFDRSWWRGQKSVLVIGVDLHTVAASVVRVPPLRRVRPQPAVV